MMPVSILDTMQRSWLTRNRMCLDYVLANLGLAVTFNVVCKCISLVYSFKNHLVHSSILCVLLLDAQFSLGHLIYLQFVF